ncbi:MAG: PilT/PilU family type 4a pilus ATPase [Planctomycetota bacterium]|jgi:twitching motility protein PilT|nr:PilT/PilU family type 4a pilus ATPase [Planctomycetota bacterium]
MSDDLAQFFEDLLAGAKHLGASDIHLLAGVPPMLRVNGEIRAVNNRRPLTAAVLIELSRLVLKPEQLECLERKRELSMSHLSPRVGRCRITFYHRLGVIEMAIRIVATDLADRETLGLPSFVDDVILQTSGLVLITGPTGSGKTTTLNYMIDAINKARDGKIITIEDPVEFSHTHRRCIVTQIEVGTDTTGFAPFLRSALRLDPDVIVIGEMRDQETIATALTAAETGHLVLGTLHTPSAIGTAERIINVFPGDMQTQIANQTASTLLGVLSQRLIPSVEKSRLVLATEVLIVNSAVRHMIRERTFFKLRYTLMSGAKQGMHTLECNLANLYRTGLISRAMAYSHANNSADLDALLRDAPQEEVEPK